MEPMGVVAVLFIFGGVCVIVTLAIAIALVVEEKSEEESKTWLATSFILLLVGLVSLVTGAVFSLTTKTKTTLTTYEKLPDSCIKVKWSKYVENDLLEYRKLSNCEGTFRYIGSKYPYRHVDGDKVPNDIATEIITKEIQ